MKQEVLRRLWDTELSILGEIDRICQKHNIRYYLMWGTLIGAVRHQGFIPWDDDIDINMPQKDYFRFLKIAKKELPEHLFLQTPFTDKYHPVYFAKVRMNGTAFCAKGDNNVKKHRGIFVDVLPFFEVKNKDSFWHKFRKKLASRIRAHVFAKRQGSGGKSPLLSLLPTTLLMRICQRLMCSKGNTFASEGYYFDKADFEPATTLTFEGREYPVPKNYDKVLRGVFGDYMQLPPEDKRAAHNPGRISFDTSLPDEITD